MQKLSWSAEHGMSDGSGVVFDLPRSTLDTEKSCLVFEQFSNVDNVSVVRRLGKRKGWIIMYTLHTALASPKLYYIAATSLQFTWKIFFICQTLLDVSTALLVQIFFSTTIPVAPDKI